MAQRSGCMILPPWPAHVGSVLRCAVVVFVLVVGLLLVTEWERKSESSTSSRRGKERRSLGACTETSFHITSQSSNSSPRLLYFPLSVLRNYPVHSNLDAFQGSRLRSRVSHHPNQDQGPTARLVHFPTRSIRPILPPTHSRSLVRSSARSRPRLVVPLLIRPLA